LELIDILPFSVCSSSPFSGQLLLVLFLLFGPFFFLFSEDMFQYVMFFWSSIIFVALVLLRSLPFSPFVPFFFFF